jgi:hypothetical protein
VKLAGRRPLGRQQNANSKILEAVGGVQVLTRALSILDALAKGDEGRALTAAKPASTGLADPSLRSIALIPSRKLRDVSLHTQRD